MLFVDFANARVPVLGFGTWLMEGDDAREGVRHALELGYRHIDTAQIYGNEREVGEGMQEAGVPREEIFLATKVWRKHLHHDEVFSSTDESLGRLRTDYIDLLLIHWPNEEVPLEETLQAMMQLREQGTVRHLGVSNFTPSMFRRATEIDPQLATNQVEYHPFLAQDRLLEMVRERGMFLTAYSPLARGTVRGNEVIEEIAAGHGKSAAQVALRWLIQQDRVITIPKASSPEHRMANLEVFDFELSDEEMRRISRLAHRNGRLVDVGYIADWEDG